METKKDRLEQNNPEKAYHDEFDQKGTTFTDSPIESEARDRAKILRTASPDSQKIDGNNPFADEDSLSDDEINRETYDDHK